jgi:putative transcriptional regulator
MLGAGTLSRWSLLLVAVSVGFAPVDRAAVGALTADDHPAEFITGRLLIASESMGDSRFQETVIYMLEHNENGAMGLIVNVPLGEVPFEDLFAQLGVDGDGAGGGLDVHYGGPVEPGRGFLLHSDDVMVTGSMKIADSIVLTTQPEILLAIARGEGPAQQVFALGYSGWGPGQLESELARDAWFVIAAESGLIFAADPARSWKRAVARRSIDL